MSSQHPQQPLFVDNILSDKQFAASSSASFPASFEDFFNMDSLVSSSTAPDSVSGGASSSRSSSHSPPESFSQLPPTPPQQQLSSFDPAAVNFGGLPTIEEDSLFNFQFDDAVDYLKNDPMAALSAGAPFAFLGGFVDSTINGGSVTSTSSSGTSPSASANGASATQAPLSGFSAIDPQLMATPAPSSAASAMGDEEEEGEDDEEDEDGFLLPMKVGGKGKGRKGTVQSGGIVKKSGGEKIDASDKERLKDSVPDDWRPSPEEYQKMSSKEKRQLRNKISARNFRVRRKEYITTLEGDIAERDKLIDAIRGELGSTKSENTALRQEVAALKKAILEGRASPMLPPPAPLSPMSPVATISPLATSISANTASSSSSSHNLLKVNTTKDLPNSPRLAAAGSAFWGGQTGFGTFGGITPVHTTLIPEYGFGMSSFVGKPAAPTANDSRRSSENMNPALNHVSVPIAVAASKVFAANNSGNNSRRSSSPVLSTMPAPATSNTLGSEANEMNSVNQNLLMSHLLGQNAHGFDAFSDVNPFTLKALDSYRMQLWGRVAAQQGANSQRYPMQSTYNGHSSANTSPSSTPSPSSSPNPGLQGLASNLRPLYFSSPTSSRSSLSSLLSGKPMPSSSSSHAAYPTPPASPKLSGRKSPPTQTPAQQQQMQQALFASLASQTLLQKMGHAFWDAFSGSSSSSSSSQPKSWDAEKVRKVLDGSAVLKVVDVEPQAQQVRPTVAASTSPDVSLEESMRAMSLGAQKEKESMCFLGRSKAKLSCSKTA